MLDVHARDHQPAPLDEREEMNHLMNEDQTDNERRRVLQRLATNWPNAWGRGVNEEYSLACRDLTPAELNDAVSEAIRDRTVIPKPAQLRNIAIDTRAALQNTQREVRRATASRGDGVGCPICRQDDPYANHTRWTANGPAYWAGDGTWIACHEHNYMWRGDTHQDDDSGEVPAGHERQALTQTGA